jgi:hypothetical protein
MYKTIFILTVCMTIVALLFVPDSLNAQSNESPISTPTPFTPTPGPFPTGIGGPLLLPTVTPDHVDVAARTYRIYLPIIGRR